MQDVPFFCIDEDDDYEEAIEIRPSEVRRDVEIVISESELAARGGWRQRSACLGLPPELFFPKRNGVVGPFATAEDRRRLDVAVGKKNSDPEDLCVKCEVRAECLSEAIYADEVGTWGGRARLSRHAVSSVLMELKPHLLDPPCGTADGWFRHIRNADDPCDPCREAARQAGHDVTPYAASPLRRSLEGMIGKLDEMRPDASAEVPAQDSLLAL